MSRVLTAFVLGLAIVGCSSSTPPTQPKSPTPDKNDDGGDPDPRKKIDPKKSAEMDPAELEAQDKSIKFVEQRGGKLKRAGKAIVEADLKFKPVTDDELKELTGLKYLQTLDLSFTQVTDSGLRDLTAFKNLTTLSLRGTKVTGATLRELSSLKNLKSLDLHVTHVNDQGLREIASIKSLTTLNIEQLLEDTAEGVQDLQRLLPNCKIISKWLGSK